MPREDAGDARLRINSHSGAGTFASLLLTGLLALFFVKNRAGSGSAAPRTSHR